MNILKNLVTLGPVGYMAASGTVASLAALPLIYAAHYLGVMTNVFCIAMIYSLSIYALKKTRRAFNSSDPREVVIDELVGMWITLLGIGLNHDRMFIGFLLFRAFDISKIGSAWVERRKDAHGIMLDDVIAGLISNICMHIALGFGWL